VDADGASARDRRRQAGTRALIRLLPDWLTPDGRKLLAMRVLRGFAYGYVGVSLGLFLAALRLDDAQIGLVFAAAMAGAAVTTIAWSVLADRLGRRRSVAVMSILMGVGGLLFAFAGDISWLLLGAFTGTINATAAEVGSFQTVEQAILPQTVSPERRTALFSLYAMAGNLAQAFGSLFSAVVGLLAGLGLVGADAFRPLFVLYALVGFAGAAVLLTLSPAVELARSDARPEWLNLKRSRAIVLRISGFFALDSFGGGFVVQSLAAYWFHVRWGFELRELAGVFFAAILFAAASQLAAGRLAERIGLVNTMVWTHLPSNVFLILVPFMPSAELAVACFLVRNAISQMDVPTRQSYLMAVVEPSERTIAAGVTMIARTVATAVGTAAAGVVFTVAPGLIFVAGGGAKIVYDLLLYRSFRAIRPPEEQAGLAAATR